MIWLRKGVVYFLSLVLFISLLGGVWALDLNYNFSQPAKLKTWLHASKVYDKAVTATLKSSQQDAEKNGTDTSVSLTDPNVQAAAQQAFTPELLENSVNTFIDANYAWLQGKTATPSFNIDLATTKADFATRVGNAVRDRLAGLKVCTPAEQAQLQIPVNVYTVTCRPASLDPATEGNRVKDEILNNQEFLGKPVINADNVNKQGSKPSEGNPYYIKLSKAPELYKAGQKAPLIFAVLALLSALGIIFISVVRRKGWRQVGIILTISGIILLVTKFGADAIATAITRRSLDGTVATGLKQPRDDLVRVIESQLVKFDLVFGALFLILGIVIFIALKKTGGSKPKLPLAGPSPTVPATEIPSDDTPPTPVRTVDDLPKFKQPQPKPKRPPRLIQ